MGGRWRSTSEMRTEATQVCLTRKPKDSSTFGWAPLPSVPSPTSIPAVFGNSPISSSTYTHNLPFYFSLLNSLCNLFIWPLSVTYSTLPSSCLLCLFLLGPYQLQNFSLIPLSCSEKDSIANATIVGIITTTSDDIINVKINLMN